MKNKVFVFILVLGVVLWFFSSVASKSNPQPAPSEEDLTLNKQERDAFVESVIVLNKSRDLSNQGLPIPRKIPQEKEGEIISLAEEGVALSKNVGDEFLDSLHSELKLSYRGKLIKGTELWLEGVKNSNEAVGVAKQVEGNKLVDEWLEWFEKNGKSFESKIF